MIWDGIAVLGFIYIGLLWLHPTPLLARIFLLIGRFFDYWMPD
jgi:hypothetical protein